MIQPRTNMILNYFLVTGEEEANTLLAPLALVVVRELPSSLKMQSKETEFAAEKEN